MLHENAIEKFRFYSVLKKKKFYLDFYFVFFFLLISIEQFKFQFKDEQKKITKLFLCALNSVVEMVCGNDY